MEQYEDDELYALFEKVKRLHHHRVVELFDEVGLKFGQPPILFALLDRDGQTQTELSRHRKLTPATITATLQRMEKGGWIVRESDPEDSRVSRVYLTEKARSIQLLIEAKLKQLQQETFENFSEVEKALIKRLFQQMEENLSRSC